MIRINLLGIKKEVKAGRAPVSLEGAKMTGLALAILGLALAFLAGHYYLLQKEEDKLRADIKAARDEKDRLAQVKAQYELHAERKAFLTQRINIIDNLQRQRTGPVEMLNSLASTVAQSPTLWLTSFENSGDKASLEGIAVSVNAVSEFVGLLGRSGYFKNVEIREISQDERAKDVTNFTFQLSAELVMASAAGSITPPGTPGARPPS